MTRTELTVDEVVALRSLVDRRNLLTSQVNEARLRVTALERELVAQGREQDLWMLSFLAKHGLPLSALRKIQIDPAAGVVLTP